MGMRQNVAHFLPDAELGISHGAALALRLSHLGFHDQVEAAPLTEDFLENVDQLLLALLCHNGIHEHQVHFVRLREGNLGSRKQMIQKDTVVFQLEQDARTVHLQKVFRRILARQIEPLNNLHAQRHVGKELLLDLALQLINIFFVNPLMADHIDPQQIFFLIDRYPRNLHGIEKLCHAPFDSQIRKYFLKLFFHSYSCFLFYLPQ